MWSFLVIPGGKWAGRQVALEGGKFHTTGASKANL
jgi:hypothetical protein